MHLNIFTLPVFMILCAVMPAVAKHTGYLDACIKKQMPHNGQLLYAHYEEQQNNTYHSPEPWQTLHHVSYGSLWCNGVRFMQTDTINGKAKKLVSKQQWGRDELLQQSYRNDKIGNVSREELEAAPLELARYTPLPLLQHMDGRGLKPVIAGSNIFYRDTVGGAAVALAIDRKSLLVNRISILRAHDIWGDVLTEISYDHYGQVAGVFYPQLAIIQKVHGIRDTVSMGHTQLLDEAAPVLVKPEGYEITATAAATAPVFTEKYSDHIYRIVVPGAESACTLVAFRDFFALIDAPLGSAYGDQVLQEIRKIDPVRPVRYFLYGHYHPWYLGGVRSLIHAGATVVCVPEDTGYVRFIAIAPHRLQPDSLSLQPVPLHMEMLTGHKTISDGTMQLEVYHIGSKSEHTADYTLFYLPAEKLLLEDDLAWIAKGPPEKAGSRQVALYNAIRELGIAPDTIMQHWPVSDHYAVKDKFSFEELEQSVQLK